MTRYILAVIMVALMAVPAFGQSFETLTIADTASGFTAATISGYSSAVCGPLQTAQIRFRVDGTSPDASTGHLLEVGQLLVIENGVEMANFKGIRTGASSGILPCTYSHRNN